MSVPRIRDFYAGTGVLVTGGSGYLGKVLVEKLLRTCADLRHVYVLLRPKHGRTAEQRLQRMLAADVFGRLRAEQPERLLKLRCLAGDLLAADLGLDAAALECVRRDVGIVLHSAATVRFDEPMRVAIEANVLALRRLLDLCAECRALKSIVVVSTSYANGARLAVDECVYAPHIPIDYDWFVEQLRTLPDPVARKLAEHVEGSFVNTYTVTKLLAEQIIAAEYHGRLPICIVRPSVIMPTLREPFPGWMDQMVGPIYLLSQAMLGTSTYFMCTDDAILDIVPLDVCANMCLAAAWYNVTAAPAPVPVLRVFNCTSGALNPITMERGTRLLVEKSRTMPSRNTMLYPNIVLCRSRAYVAVLALLFHVLPAAVLDVCARLAKWGRSGDGGEEDVRRPDGLLMSLARKGLNVTLMNRFFVTHQWTYGIGNVLGLIASIAGTPDGERDFPCDVRAVSYPEYAPITTLGFRRHFLHEPDSTLPLARRRLRRITALKYAFHAVQAAVAVLAVRWVWQRLAAGGIMGVAVFV